MMYRSMLFVPGQQASWVEKATAAQPDAIILDLEDAVPESQKDLARVTVASSIDAVHQRARGDLSDVWVRPNAWESRRAGGDVEATVRPGLSGFVLPKVYGRDDVLRFDALVSHCEIRSGLIENSIRLIPVLETAEAMAQCEEIAAASPRVASLVAIAARDGDASRALRCGFTDDGLETLYLRSRALLASRAAHHQFALCGLWQEVRDLEGLTRFARREHTLGYDGQLVIHPSHVEPVHQVYTPSAQMIELYEGLIEAFSVAEAEGKGAVEYRGQHVDRAHYQTARAIVERARRGDT